YLRQKAGAGAPDAGTIAYGVPGWQPVVGRWDGGSADGIGVIDPNSLTWRLRGSSGALVAPFTFGAPSWVGVAGSWDTSAPPPASAEAPQASSRQPVSG